MQETLTNRPLFSPEEFEMVLFDSKIVRKRLKEEMEALERLRLENRITQIEHSND